MQYHDVKINVTMASAPPGVSSSNSDLSVSLWADFVFLDTAERTRYVQQPHEYLIEQLQFTGSETAQISASSTASQNLRLNFNHPTKYLAFVMKNPSYHGCYTAIAPTDYANTETYNEALAPLYSAKLQINGQDRFVARKGSYFNALQAYQNLQGRVPAGVYMYSFALRPAEHQGSGTINFSRIDNATLSLTYKQASITNDDSANVISESVTYARATALTNLNVYAKNYNVLRIIAGMGGVAYAS